MIFWLPQMTINAFSRYHTHDHLSHSLHVFRVLCSVMRSIKIIVSNSRRKKKQDMYFKRIEFITLNSTDTGPNIIYTINSIKQNCQTGCHWVSDHYYNLDHYLFISILLLGQFQILSTGMRWCFQAHRVWHANLNCR